MAHQLAMGVKKWWETLQHVLVICLEGLFGAWHWHQVVLGKARQDHWLQEGLSLLCELTGAFSSLRVRLCPGHVLQLPEFPLLLLGISGGCFCALHQVS